MPKLDARLTEEMSLLGIPSGDFVGAGPDRTIHKLEALHQYKSLEGKMLNKKTVCVWILAVALIVVPAFAGASIHAGTDIQRADGGAPVPPPPGSGSTFILSPTALMDGGAPVPPPPGSGSIA